MIERRHILLLAGLMLLATLSFLLSLLSGSVNIPLVSVWSTLLLGDGGLEYQILHELRIPRTLAAFVTGAMLALSGVLMQVLLRNPLADPYILGISGGAAVGALSAMLLGVSSMLIANAAFLGALVSVLIVFGLASLRRDWSSSRLLLTGVVVAAGWGAVINLLLTTTQSNTVQSMLFWLMGDLSQSRVGIGHYVLLMAGLLLTLALARPLNALAHGELNAAALGVNVGRLKVILYFSAAALTATAVTIAGTVGFVGLIVPHMLRLLGARDHRILLPASALLGGSFLVLADSLARSIIAPQQLPVGVLTALIGVPAFLIILQHNRRPPA